MQCDDRHGGGHQRQTPRQKTGGPKTAAKNPAGRVSVREVGETAPQRAGGGSRPPVGYRKAGCVRNHFHHIRQRLPRSESNGAILILGRGAGCRGQRDGEKEAGRGRKRRGSTAPRRAVLVRREGVEPPRLAALEPKSSVSTNFTTGATGRDHSMPARRVVSLLYLGHGSAQPSDMHHFKKYGDSVARFIEVNIRIGMREAHKTGPQARFVCAAPRLQRVRMRPSQRSMLSRCVCSISSSPSRIWG